ncbi:PrsW family glutamic-type intramembrane protease [Plantibacter sp. VKM Ac-2876]|uniref:PrsW family glutamic-type intramembrane protease n=1 Tax=Plantibacter sp. VKM Ac-2876 TaxID=2783826 RepID=UPI00188A2B72|nr:PrsW family glutamic-type intramembrane protease [Plantibacter sp. VKM Ac-2876]MBF4563737.1 PrsW family intramembrane metalloprotease [Plantibacter sp. VKM Ac-2876]
MSHAAPSTTPETSDTAVPLWRHAHAPAWFFFGGLALWLFLLLVPHVLLGNPAVIPAWILLGSGLAASTLLLIMARRLQSGDGVTTATLLWAVLVGGFIAITLGSTFDSLIGVAATDAGENPHDIGLFFAGVAEELAKIIAVVIVAWRLPVKTARGGLFVGGAVGIGFAVLENLWYIGQGWANGVEASQKLAAGSPPLEMILSHPAFQAAGAAFARTIFDPVGHPLWTALFAAALFAAARNGRFRITVGVLLTYLLVAVMHGLWDGNTVLWGLLFPSMPVLKALVVPAMVVLVVAFALIWRARVRRINRDAGVVSLHVPRRERKQA